MSQDIAEQVIGRFVQTWNAHDVEAFANCFKSDGTFVNVLAREARGRRAIAGMHKFPFARVQAKAIMSVQRVEFRSLTDRLVGADVWWKVRGSTNPLGMAVGDRGGYMYCVIDTADGTGSIISTRNLDQTDSYGRGLGGVLSRVLKKEKRTMRLCVLICSPDSDSLNHALASAYVEGARSAGNEVAVLDLYKMAFDPILRTVRTKQPLENDLLLAQKEIEASQRVVLFFPTWWYGPPALLKGFIDRAFTSGWAYKHKAKDSVRWTGLLKGRSGHVVYTEDTPGFVVTWIIGDPVRKAFSKGILGYIGMSPVRFTRIGSVRLSDDAKRKRWIEAVGKLGREASS